MPINVAFPNLPAALDSLGNFAILARNAFQRIFALFRVSLLAPAQIGDLRQIFEHYLLDSEPLQTKTVRYGAFQHLKLAPRARICL